MKRIEDYNKKQVTILAFSLLPLSGFAVDMYMPSLPDMATKLHGIPSDIQFTIPIYLISYGICQLMIGTLLDSYGRYIPSIAGLFFFSLASFGITYFESLVMIYFMRCLQGIMVATIIVSKRACFVDMYSGDRLKHYTSLFSIIWSVAPIIAPFIGGYLQIHLGWRSNFYFLGYYGLTCLALELIFGGETLKTKHSFHFKDITAAYWSMIRTKDFSLAIIIIAMIYSMMLVYGMASPFLIERQMGYPATMTGNASLISGVALLIGGLIAKYYITRPFFRKLLIAIVVQFAAAIFLTIFTVYFHDLYTLIAYVLIIHTVIGFIFNTLFSYALTRFTNNGGKASGLAGGGYVIFTSIFSYSIVRGLSIISQPLLGISYSLLAMIVLVLFFSTKWQEDKV